MWVASIKRKRNILVKINSTIINSNIKATKIIIMKIKIIHRIIIKTRIAITRIINNINILKQNIIIKKVTQPNSAQVIKTVIIMRINFI